MISKSFLTRQRLERYRCESGIQYLHLLLEILLTVPLTSTFNFPIHNLFTNHLSPPSFLRQFLHTFRLRRLLILAKKKPYRSFWPKPSNVVYFGQKFPLVHSGPKPSCSSFWPKAPFIVRSGQNPHVPKKSSLFWPNKTKTIVGVGNYFGSFY